MTSDELDTLYELKDQYWMEFSKLVNETLRKVPAHLRDHLAMMLQESSSVYGRDTSA
jgi:hypothetical protein